MHARCGGDLIPVRSLRSWNALISAHTRHGNGGGDDALRCFEAMLEVGISPDAFTYASVLKACSITGWIERGEEIHGEVLRRDLLRGDSVLGAALVDLYAKCGHPERGEEVLEGLLARDVVCWNALISGYVDRGLPENAFECLEKMRREQIAPDPVTFIGIARACGSSRSLPRGERIHAQLICASDCGCKLEREDVVLGTAIVDMYAKCGALARARRALEKLPVRSTVSWNAMICGYAQRGQCEEAMESLELMRSEGTAPDVVTFTCILKACRGSVGAIETGEMIHNEVLSKGLLERDRDRGEELGNALVDMYARCGAPEKAYAALVAIKSRSIVPWNALISGFVQQGRDEAAMECFFDHILAAGFCPNAVTFTCLLKACASAGDLRKGESAHDEVARRGLAEDDGILGTALVDMYARCGIISAAKQVHAGLRRRDVVSWSSLVSGYADQGFGDEALRCFQAMLDDGFSPTASSLACLLNACSHSGLVDEGEAVYVNMSSGYGVSQSSEHHACMVDLLGRSGQLEKAAFIVGKLPSSDHYPPLLGAFMGACQKWWDLRLGKLAFSQALQWSANNSAAYVCMANIYSASCSNRDDGDDTEVVETLPPERWR